MVVQLHQPALNKIVRIKHLGLIRRKIFDLERRFFCTAISAGTSPDSNPAGAKINSNFSLRVGIGKFFRS